MLIYLLRHGQTTRPGTYTGSSDVPLSAEGERQVAGLAGFLGSIHFDACYCSPLSRCKKTLELLDITTECVYDARLAEIDFGNWEGLSFSEIQSRDSGGMAAWFEMKDRFVFPGGESISGFNDRVGEWLEQLLSSRAETVLVVSHAGVIKRALCRLLGFGLHCADQFDIQEAGVAQVRREGRFATLGALNSRG